MNLDRNKTELTKDVTAAAALYLEERGFKPIETEVPICDGWVADLASVISPTATELVDLKLIKRRPQYNQPGYREWYDYARQNQRLMTVLVEVKTSRSDFSGDKKWTLPIPTDLAYLAAPSDLAISPTEIPSGWGFLIYYSESNSLRCLRPPMVNQVSVEQQLCIVHEIAVRRDHHTRYERHREFQREMRVERNKEESRTRSLHAMQAMASIVQGKHGSVSGALEYHGIKHFPAYFLEELERLWAIKPGQVNDPGQWREAR